MEPKSGCSINQPMSIFKAASEATWSVTLDGKIRTVFQVHLLTVPVAEAFNRKFAINNSNHVFGTVSLTRSVAHLVGVLAFWKTSYHENRATNIVATSPYSRITGDLGKTAYYKDANHKQVHPKRQPFRLTIL
jgi:hypothetical protein